LVLTLLNLSNFLNVFCTQYFVFKQELKIKSKECFNFVRLKCCCISKYYLDNSSKQELCKSVIEFLILVSVLPIKSYDTQQRVIFDKCHLNFLLFGFTLLRLLFLCFCFCHFLQLFPLLPFFLLLLQPLLPVDGRLRLPVPQEVCREVPRLPIAVVGEQLISCLQGLWGSYTLQDRF